VADYLPQFLVGYSQLIAPSAYRQQMVCASQYHLVINHNYKEANIMRVQNMQGHSGRAIPNQFEIYADNGVYFQSYNTMIAFKPYGQNPIQLDRSAWDYSVTTGKYRNLFLGEKKVETEAKIKSGEYILTDLNS
jgi:hypothetical protein